MKWNQFRLKTTTEAEDIVSSMLAAVSYTHLDVYKRQGVFGKLFQ